MDGHAIISRLNYPEFKNRKLKFFQAFRPSILRLTFIMKVAYSYLWACGQMTLYIRLFEMLMCSQLSTNMTYFNHYEESPYYPLLGALIR
jgi:hypothetical protein